MTNLRYYTKTSFFVLLCAFAFTACNKEPEERKAFIEFLQTRIIDARTLSIPKLDDNLRKELGRYSKDYEVISNFHEALDERVEKPYQEVTQGLALRGMDDALERRDDLVALKEALQQVTTAVVEEREKADAEHAKLRQPDDLKAVYDHAYNKTITAPADAFLEAMPLISNMMDGTIDLIDFIKANADKIEMRGGMIHATDEQVLAELNARLEAFNEQAQQAAEIQQKLMDTINGL